MFPYHFTFHNVSINTLAFRLPWLFTLSFTFHNVSINTNDNLNKTPADKVFTFHNVSINTRRLEFRLIRLNTLHSTMFLLILMAGQEIYSILNFTFHNVSINTKRLGTNAGSSGDFTFHNVSINTKILDTHFNAVTMLYIPQCFY